MENCRLSQKIKIVLKTIFFWFIAIILIFCLAVSYTVVKTFDFICLKIISMKYPQYEFSKAKHIRSLVESIRSPATYNFLVKVNGMCDYEDIRNHYNVHLLEKRNKSGEIKFPKLRCKLTSCWGYYAWIKDDSEFNPDQHIVLASNFYRGRRITEENVQNYVSDVISKNIHVNIPPWQIVVIPTTPTGSTDIFFILIRMHHLLLAEEKDLLPNNLLLIKPTSKAIELYQQPTHSVSSISGILKKPKHIPNLLTHLSMTASNRWNEFIYHFDPLESPDVDKKQPINCLSQLLSISFITIITVCSDFMKERNKIRDHYYYKFKFMMNLLERESTKRNLNGEAIVRSLKYSLNPKNVLKVLLLLVWRIVITILLLGPYYCWKEFAAMKDIIVIGRTKHSSTITSLLAIYIPLIFLAIQEFFYIIVEIFLIPRLIYEELFESPTYELNILKMQSYRGRSIISFSKTIDMNALRERIGFDPYLEIEFLYASLGASLMKFFRQYENCPVPSMINVTSHSVDKGFFFTTNNKNDHISGVVFLQLPLKEPCLGQLSTIHEISDRVRRKQIAIYITSLIQNKYGFLNYILPDILLRILINYFIINFPIAITEIHGDFTNVQTVWGQTVEDLIFFKPQISKAGVSINMHINSKQCRLAVITDSQLAPHQSEISDSWGEYMERSVL